MRGELSVGEKETRLLELFDHPGWKVYEAELSEWLGDALTLLETESELPKIFKLQGNVEALRHVVEFKNKWEPMEDER